MARDLRNMFAKEREEETYQMKKGHEARFLSKLEEEIPTEGTHKKSNAPLWLKIAASVIVIFSLGAYFFAGNEVTNTGPNTQMVGNETSNESIQTISLGNLSPDLKKIESYYVANINLELSELEFSGDNKALIDGYMERLAQLDEEYRRLNEELNNIGPNDQTINALIKNLQLRLQLLQKLKSKLNQLKSSKNEQEQSNII